MHQWRNSGTEHLLGFGVMLRRGKCCYPQNCVLHSHEDCATYAKKGQEQNTWIALKAGTLLCTWTKNSRLCWRYYLIIHSWLWLAASNNPTEASICVTKINCRCNISKGSLFAVFALTSGRKEGNLLLFTAT